MNLDYILVDVHRWSEEQLASIGDLLSNAFYLDQAMDIDLNITMQRLRKVAGNMQKFTDEEYQFFCVWLDNMLCTRISANPEEANMINKFENVWSKHLEEAEMAGVLKGILKGKLEGQKEFAVQLLRTGVIDVASLAKATGISEEEIRTWLS